MTIFTNIHNKTASLAVWLKLLLLFIAGAGSTLALPPYSNALCAFAGFSLFYYIFSTLNRPLPSFLAGWTFGFGYFAAGLWWIANALLVEGNPYSWVWPLAVAGLPALLGLFTGLACWVMARFGPKNPSASGFVYFIAILALSEWLRGHILTGFPWNLPGYIWSDAPAIAQTAALGGIYTLSLLTLFWISLPGYLLTPLKAPRSKEIICLAGILTFSACFYYGAHRMQAHETGFNESVYIKVVQPNIPQEDKWNPEKKAENFQKLLTASRLTAQEKKTLAKAPSNAVLVIIWPETALGLGAFDHPVVRQALAKILRLPEQETYLLTGILRAEKTDKKTRYFNSLALINKKLETLSVYDKAHLVPFGEFIPFQEWVPLAPFVQLTGFTPGQELLTAQARDIPPYRPLICYEVIFPSLAQTVPETPDNQTSKAEWIVTVTNDAWYGDSPGPYQHFAQARFRAIEQGVPVVRSANTGISGVIDPLGRTLGHSPLFNDISLLMPLPSPVNRLTFYAQYGDIFFWIAIISILMISGALHHPDPHKQK